MLKTSDARSVRQGVRAHRAGDVGQPARYDRGWDLPRLLPLWPHELADTSLAGRERIVAHLRHALRSERQRGIGGHWSYDLSRHAQLVMAYRSELAALAALDPGARPIPEPTGAAARPGPAP